MREARRPNHGPSDSMKARIAFRAGSPLQFVPPTPFARCWRHKPSEVSFDSRRGATLETFSSRNEHSGLAPVTKLLIRPRS